MRKVLVLSISSSNLFFIKRSFDLPTLNAPSGREYNLIADQLANEALDRHKY